MMTPLAEREEGLRAGLMPWSRQAAGRIAVVAVLYEQELDPVGAWSRRFAHQDGSGAYLVFPETAPRWSSAVGGAEPVIGLVPGVRWKTLASDELQQAQGCLCCSLRSELGAWLGQLFMRLLARQEPRVEVVFVMTGAKQVQALAQTLQHAPFLAQRYALCGHVDLG